jgi:hypothetical protein
LKQGPIGLRLYQQAIKLRRPIPPALANAPQVWPWLTVFQRAFWDLIGDRAAPEMPIPWMVRQRWAEIYGLDSEATELLHRHVKAQDLAFLGYLRDNKPKPDTKESAAKFGHGGPPAIRSEHE